MTVYVVEADEYSSRHVVCVCDDKGKAETLASQFYSGTVTEWELNVLADRLTQGYRLWAVSFWASTLELREARLWWTPEDIKGEYVMNDSWWDEPDGYEKNRRRATIDVRVVARDELEAVKIALDRARAFKAGLIPETV